MSAVLLELLLCPPVGAPELTELHRLIDDAIPSVSPTWLQEAMGSSRGHAQIINSSISIIHFTWRIDVNSIRPLSDLENILCLASKINAENKTEVTVPISFNDSSSLFLKSINHWLRAVIAISQEKCVLATNELKTSLESCPKLSCVLYTAYLAYKGRGLVAPSLDCLVLLLRVSCFLPWLYSQQKRAFFGVQFSYLFLRSYFHPMTAHPVEFVGVSLVHGNCFMTRGFLHSSTQLGAIYKEDL